MDSNIDHILTEGITFFFLILNTIFAVVVSLVYKSKTLLMFSFVFAYINPFIIGAKSDGTPYTMVGYSAIVSIGAYILSYLFSHKNEDKDFMNYLMFTGFI